MAVSMETAQDEGGDDRRREVAVARLESMMVAEYPVLTDDDLDQLREPVSAEPQPAPQKTVPAQPTAETQVEGGRALYGYEPSRDALGSIALAAAVQSSGFRPAGTGPELGRSRRLYAWQYAKRPSHYPPINGVIQSR